MKILTKKQREQFLVKWIMDLVSGKYTQASNALRARIGGAGNKKPQVGYCCLGVACDRAKREGIVRGYWRREKYGPNSRFIISVPEQKTVSLTAQEKDRGTNIGLDEDPAFIPRRLQKVLGFTQDDQDELAGWNDSGDTFIEIARRAAERFRLEDKLPKRVRKQLGLSL